jgi:hypothetical protein
VSWRKGWDSNPRYPCRHAGFQDRCLKPLGHPSVAATSSTWRALDQERPVNRPRNADPGVRLAREATPDATMTTVRWLRGSRGSRGPARIPSLFAGGRFDGHVLRAAEDARAAVLMGVASKRFQQKQKLLGKHGRSPGKSVANRRRQLYAGGYWTLVIRITGESGCAFTRLRKNDRGNRGAGEGNPPIVSARDQSAPPRFPLRDVARTI